MTAPSRAPRTVALWALRALAVLVVAVVGVASSPTARPPTQLDGSSFVRAARAAHEIASLRSPLRRIDRLAVTAAGGDRSPAHVGPALPLVPFHLRLAAPAPSPAPAFEAPLSPFVARIALAAVGARGPPFVV